jgi:sarcosine oxidase
METADILVVGLGAMGSAAVYQAAKRGARVIGIDRFAPPHAHGSTLGESRITREAVGEGEVYVPFAMRSHRIWREIEAETGETLFLACGGLFLESGGIAASHPGKEQFLDRTIAAAQKFGIAHEVLDAGKIAARYPQFRLTGDERGYFEPGAGLVRPEACVAAQLTLARRHGAAVHTGETVTKVLPNGGGARVETNRAIYEAGRVILAAGAWNGALAGAAIPLTVHRQVLFWFEAEDPAPFRPERFPVFIWMHGDGAEDWFYGFPMLPGALGVKLASETFADPQQSPEAVQREIGPDEAQALYNRHVAGRLNGLRPTCSQAATCLYTATPDHHFLIDRHPDSEHILLVSACSGHGFKHSAAIGEAAAELAITGRSTLDVSAFGLGRLSGTGPAA